tara:strand:+ start:180 stop:812 length:633 start_codon:yes stop_codon:yes gene_type:complete
MGNITTYNVQDLMDKYSLQIFVETGTLYGDAVEHARNFLFTKIISIEIEEDLAAQCRAKFSHDSRVHIITGDSSIKMSEAVSLVDSPCLYWLDAHFPGGDRDDEKRKGYMETEDINSRVPLLKELEAIKNNPFFKESVILIDDARLFERENENLNNHLKSIGQGNINRDMLCEYDSSQIQKILDKTHTITRISATGEGNYIAIPKQKEEI